MFQADCTLLLEGILKLWATAVLNFSLRALNISLDWGPHQDFARAPLLNYPSTPTGLFPDWQQETGKKERYHSIAPSLMNLPFAKDWPQDDGSRLKPRSLLGEVYTLPCELSHPHGFFFLYRLLFCYFGHLWGFTTLGWLSERQRQMVNKERKWQLLPKQCGLEPSLCTWQSNGKTAHRSVSYFMGLIFNSPKANDTVWRDNTLCCFASPPHPPILLSSALWNCG